MLDMSAEYGLAEVSSLEEALRWLFSSFLGLALPGPCQGLARLMFFCEVDGSRGRGREHEKLGAWFEYIDYGAYCSHCSI